MPRIPEDELDRLKETVSLERLVTEHGITLKRHGADLIGLCPFHNDKNPSLVVSPKKNLWHCLGACQQGGTVIDWVMKTHGISFRHAAELLRADAPLLPAAPGVRYSTVRHLPVPLDPGADDRALLLQVARYYHETLKRSPEGLAYLEQRGLKSAELIERFKLGYANRTLGLRLPFRNRGAGEAIRGRLQALGLYRDSGHEHFNGSLVVPIFDEQGNVAEMYGRKITPRLRHGTPLHLYLPGPHHGVWNHEALRLYKEIILCEALIDAMTFWVHGYKNVTAAYGIEGFTQEHLDAFKKHGVQRLLIAYDRDEAGDKAAERLAEKLLAAGFACYRVQFPRGMDANEYALKIQPAHKSLGLVLRKALWLGKGRAPVLDASENPLVTIQEPEPEPTVTEAPLLPLAAEMQPAAAQPLEPPSSEPAPTPDPPPAAEPPGAEPLAVGPAALQAAPPLEAAPPEAAPLASPVPPAPVPDVRTEQKEREVWVQIGERRYRIRGMEKNLCYDQLRVNVAAFLGDTFHVDTFDLYAAKARDHFIKAAHGEMSLSEDVIRKDLGKVLLKLEELQEALIRKTLDTEPAAPQMDEHERAAALDLLKDPRLMERIAADFEKCGIVGEQTNAWVGYLAALSRKLEEPLAVLIQSSSAAGKSSLLDAVLGFVPEEERSKYAAMTGQSLYYMGEKDLAHKVLAIVEEEGASRASYALKLLQSEGELTIASTGKDAETGRLVTQEYKVRGPVMLLLTTTAIDLDEELLNRCIVLTVNEGREQTQAIHRLQRQRQTLAGLLARRDADETRSVHQNAQRLLAPLLVVNPYAEALTFLDHKTRTRRDHMKYLTLIRAVALLHQHQRPVKSTFHNGARVDYIEVTAEDIRWANRLAHDVLGRSLDELPAQTRRLLGLLDAYVKEQTAQKALPRSEVRFTRREVREHTGLGDTQLKIHMGRLVELEYLVLHRAPKGNGFFYELCYEGQGQDGAAFLSGLLDPDNCTYDASRSGQNEDRSGSGRASVGPRSGVGRALEIPLSSSLLVASEEEASKGPKTRVAGGSARAVVVPEVVGMPNALAAKG